MTLPTLRVRRSEEAPASAPFNGPEIIIIAPAEMLSRIECQLPGNLLRAFATLEELDRWRHPSSVATSGIAGEVSRALSEAGCGLLWLPVPLRSLLEAMAAAEKAPLLHDLQAQWHSRRSFYRTWGAAIPSTPSAFLRRVRSLHAQRLLTQGMTRKRAAMVAGFGSVDAMRRNIGRDP